MASAARLGRVRCLLAGVALLAALIMPHASVGAEALPAYDERTLAALDLLDASPATHQLRAVLESNRVSIRFVSMGPGVYARYSLGRHAIEIDPQWQDADVVSLAAVIAHEATHAEDAVSGYLASGAAGACIDSEVRAFRTAALFWLDVFGPSGKQSAHGELDHQLNAIAQRELHDPRGLEDLVRQTYAEQCGPAEGGAG